MLQAIAKSALDLDALGSARALFRLRQPVDLVYASIYVKVLLLLGPPPRSGGYDVYIHAVYVVILYVCYMYVSITYCYMLYVCDMLYVCYMSSSRALLIYVYVCYMLLYDICLLYVICLLSV